MSLKLLDLPLLLLILFSALEYGTNTPPFLYVNSGPINYSVTANSNPIYKKYGNDAKLL
jgi:hypothetical protein